MEDVWRVERKKRPFVRTGVLNTPVRISAQHSALDPRYGPFCYGCGLPRGIAHELRVRIQEVTVTTRL